MTQPGPSQEMLFSDETDASPSSLHTASYHALNTAYEELKYRYNDLQGRHRQLQRQMRTSRFEDDLKLGPVVPGIPSPGSVDLERSDSSQLAQKNQEIEELRTQLRAKADLDTRVTELERENDKLIKLNHDLTYGHSNHLTQQLMEVNQQLDLCRKELTMVKKDYQDLLQENEHVVKRNLILEKNVKERESLIPEQLSNGHLSPSEDSRIQDVDMDAEELQQLVVMSMSSKDEMARLKEKVWKLNEVVRILLRQQHDRSVQSRMLADAFNNAEAPSGHTGQGARPKSKPYVIHGGESSHTSRDSDMQTEDKDCGLRRSHSMQSKKKSKNMDFDDYQIGRSRNRPKSNFEYEYGKRYDGARDRSDKTPTKVKYTTHINLDEAEMDHSERGLPKIREKNDYRSEMNRRPREDFRNRIDLSPRSPDYENDRLGMMDIKRPVDLLEDMEKPGESHGEDLFSEPLPRGLGTRTDSLEHLHDDELPLVRELEPDLSEEEDFMTLTAVPQMPQSPSWEDRNNRRTRPPANPQSTSGANPRPLNIDRNECEPSARSYDNSQPQNVNLNTGQEKFRNSSRPGFAILNNDPLVGNKTIPSKNIYQETVETATVGTTRRQEDSESLPRTPEEHDDSLVTRTCPVCSEVFTISLPQFEAHVDACISSNGDDDQESLVLQEREERLCPMCNKLFPDSIPQSEFEVHVNDHFELNFEMVHNT